jgi:small subunit ribosomal protein S17
MAKKKVEEVEETVEAAVETEVSEDAAVEAKAEEVVTAAAEEVPAKKAAPKKAAKAEPAAKKPAKEKKAAAPKDADAADGSTVHRGKRAEKIGVVASDLMTKTVTVRVDRLVKHPVYRKYVRKRKKFMAHDELGAKIGDKVRIIETRPLSARKRWRVVEIIQKAER